MKIRINLVGRVMLSNNYGYFKVLSQRGSYSEIQFIETGFTKTVETRSARSGEVKDPLLPFVNGVGFIGVGDFRSTIKGKATREYSRWKLMMDRCYSDNYQSRNKSYIGCEVCDYWHNFQNFAKWFVDNHPSDGLDYHLDKDLKSGGKGKLYSPSTCVFITRDENNEIAHAKSYSFTNPDGKTVEVFNLRKFCRENDLNQGCMGLVASGKRKTHKGWTT